MSDVGQMMASNIGLRMTQGDRSLAPYGLRHDGAGAKGRGFMGPLTRPDGGVSTELSAGMNVDGKDAEVPLLVPTLSKEEIAHLLSDGEPTGEIYAKAMEHAQQRMRSGQSPFAGMGDLMVPAGWGQK